MKLFSWSRSLRIFQFDRADDRRFFSEWVLLTLSTLVLLGVCVALNILTPLGNVIFDGVQKIREQHTNKKIIVVAIDDRSLSELGGWPLSRSLYADFLKKLADTGNFPAAIGFDILMVDATVADNDFSKQIARHRVILPVELRYSEAEKKMMVRPLPSVIQSAAVSLSHINVSFDEDGFIRGSRLAESGVPHFSLAMSGLAIPNDAGQTTYVRFSLMRPDIGFPTISLSDALQNKYPLSIFKDAYVLVGATAPSLGDHYPSIYSGRQMAGTPGVIFQASLLNDLLQGNLITSASSQVSFVIYAVCLLMILFGILVLTPSAEMILTLFMTGMFLFISIFLLLKFNYWLDPSPLLITVLAVKPLWAWRRMKMIIRFMQERAREISYLEPSPQKMGRWELLSQDAVLRYSNILDRAIQVTKNRLENFEKVIHDLPEAIFILNADHELLLANKKFKLFFEAYQFKSTVSIDVLLGYLGHSFKYLQELLALPAGQKYLNIKNIQGSSGEYLVHQVQLQFDSVGELTLIMFVEVTELLRFQSQRDRTLQLLSHDMRTPVASILALCRKALLGNNSKEDADQSAHQITAQSKRLLSLMDDFILSIRADEPEYNLITILWDNLLDQAMYEVRHLMEERQMTIRVEELCEDIFIKVQIRLIERVLVNLLVNAVRYGQGGTEIVIRTARFFDEQDLPMVKCDIMNVVGGADHSSRIQAESKGFGLGLYFVDQVVARHGGSIVRHFPSDIGSMATVSIIFPISLHDDALQR